MYDSRQPICTLVVFEAGALAKTIDDSYVVPYLIDDDLNPSIDLKPPLAQFQARRATQSDTLDMILDINSVLHRIEPNAGLNGEELRDIFDGYFWAELQKRLDEIPKEPTPRPKRDTREMLEEILEQLRGRNETVEYIVTQQPTYTNAAYSYTPPTTFANPVYFNSTGPSLTSTGYALNTGTIFPQSGSFISTGPGPNAGIVYIPNPELYSTHLSGPGAAERPTKPSSTESKDNPDRENEPPDKKKQD
jgi:hypothetical protein